MSSVNINVLKSLAAYICHVINLRDDDQAGIMLSVAYNNKQLINKQANVRNDIATDMNN